MPEIVATDHDDQHLRNPDHSIPEGVTGFIFIDWKHEAGLARGGFGKLTAGKGSVWNRL